MGKTIRNQPHQKLFENIKALLHEARSAVARNINTAMVITYFEIGRMIVEHEQEGAKRAEYAKEVLKSVSQRLTPEFGRGFSVNNLELMRRLYLVYSKSETLSRKSGLPISQTLSAKSETASRLSPVIFQLSWSHYVFLMRLPEAEREFYEANASEKIFL